MVRPRRQNAQEILLDWNLRRISLWQNHRGPEHNRETGDALGHCAVDGLILQGIKFVVLKIFLTLKIVCHSVLRE